MLKYNLDKFSIQKHKKFGRSHGTIVTRHKGGGNKYLYLHIDYNYRQYINTVNYGIILQNFVDFNRNIKVSLILFLNGTLKGKKKIISNINNIKVGSFVEFTNNLDNLSTFMSTNTTNIIVNQIKYFPIGTLLCNMEFVPYKGVKLARAKGAYAKIVYHVKNFTFVRMPSGKIKLLLNNCIACVGHISNNFADIKVRKAGYFRALNIRPTVRGNAMNAVDHPHGGGTGKTSIGLKTSKTIWGKYQFGVKTSKNK